MFAIAVLLGLVVGVGCFMPLIFGMNLARKATPTSSFGHAGSLLLGVLLSFTALGVAIVICVLVARDVAAFFALGAAGGLCLAAVVFGVSKNLRK